MTSLTVVWFFWLTDDTQSCYELWTTQKDEDLSTIQVSYSNFGENWYSNFKKNWAKNSGKIYLTLSTKLGKTDSFVLLRLKRFINLSNNSRCFIFGISERVHKIWSVSTAKSTSISCNESHRKTFKPSATPNICHISVWVTIVPYLMACLTFVHW